LERFGRVRCFSTVCHLLPDVQRHVPCVHLPLGTREFFQFANDGACYYHSVQVCARCHTFDYSGIVVLTVGSFFPCIYYGFFCSPVYQSIYLFAISLAGACAAYVVLNPEYAKPTHRVARTKVFIALGLGGTGPLLHGLVSHGYRKLCYEMGFGFIILSGLSYILGALVYANRIPERFAPGKFDTFFSSHQLFHVCVILAALSHYACVLTAFHHWHGARGVIACVIAAA